MSPPPQPRCSESPAKIPVVFLLRRCLLPSPLLPRTRVPRLSLHALPHLHHGGPHRLCPDFVPLQQQPYQRRRPLGAPRVPQSFAIRGAAEAEALGRGTCRDEYDGHGSQRACGGCPGLSEVAPRTVIGLHDKSMAIDTTRGSTHKPWRTIFFGFRSFRATVPMGQSLLGTYFLVFLVYWASRVIRADL